uniref:Odorant-binding protein 57e2 n=1 Tax=Drosophila constricta TaxID=94112 RepID=B0M2F3_9MUSC|nr:odorant-binding protein 57e2 [Drosophila constricta]
MLDRLALYLFVIILGSKVQGDSVVFNPCTSQKELSEADTLMVLENWPDNHNVSLIDRSYKCFITCVLIDLGLINGTGQVQIDKYVKSGNLDWKWVATELAPCRSKYLDEADLCEFAFGIFNCFRERKLAAENIGK